MVASAVFIVLQLVVVGVGHWLVYRVAYKRGVLEGLTIGRFEATHAKQTAAVFPSAQAIVDAADAEIVWKLAIEEKHNA